MGYAKNIFPIFFALLGFCSLRSPAVENQSSFPFKSPEIDKATIDTSNRTGFAILNKGQLLYFKRWATDAHNAFEATLIDANLYDADKKDWFNEKYVQSRILWLSDLVLNKVDKETVAKVFRDQKFKKTTGKNGEIIYSIPGTTYSEFFFAVKQPGDYFEQTSIKVRYVMQL
jgi:hypothetical protein